MNVDEQIREWRSKQASKKVCAGKADQDDDQSDNRHCGEEEIVGPKTQARARRGSGHEPSVRVSKAPDLRNAHLFYANLYGRLRRSLQKLEVNLGGVTLN
jgi:hypothetical protein